MTFETFDQSDEETWPDQNFDKDFCWQFSHFLTIFNNFDNFWEFLGVLKIFESFENCWVLTIFESFHNFWQFGQIWTILTIWTFFYNLDNFHNILQFGQFLKMLIIFYNWKDNPRDWQLRTWIYDNLCYLTINCDTG